MSTTLPKTSLTGKGTLSTEMMVMIEWPEVLLPREKNHIYIWIANFIKLKRKQGETSRPLAT